MEKMTKTFDPPLLTYKGGKEEICMHCEDIPKGQFSPESGKFVFILRIVLLIKLYV